MNIGIEFLAAAGSRKACLWCRGHVSESEFFTALGDHLKSPVKVRQLRESGGLDFRYAHFKPSGDERQGHGYRKALPKDALSFPVALVFLTRSARKEIIQDLKSGPCMHCDQRPIDIETQNIYCVECLRWFQYEMSGDEKDHGVFPDPSGYDGEPEEYYEELIRRGLLPAGSEAGQ